MLVWRVLDIPFGGKPTPMTPRRLRVCGVTAFAAVHRSTAAPKDDAEPDADRSAGRRQFRTVLMVVRFRVFCSGGVCAAVMRQ